MTADPSRRVERALAAAQATLQAGAFDAALGLVAKAEAGPLGEFQRAQVDLLRGNVAFASGLGSDAPPMLMAAANRLEPFDLELARETYLTAWGAASLSGGSMLLEVSRAVRALPPPSPPRPLDLLLDGLALLITDGHAAAAPTLQRAATAIADISVDEVRRWGWMAHAASSAVWDVGGMHAIAAREVQLVRDAGALAQLPMYLSSLGMACEWMGDFASAASLAAEIDSVAAAIGSPIGPFTLLRLRALQGREAEVCAAMATAFEQAAARGQGQAATWAHWAAAVLYNGLSRYEDAASAAQQATSGTSPWPQMWVLAELVEAAARRSDTELARDALDRLVDTTQPCATDWALGIQARCQALLSDGAAADDLYREAIDRLSRSRLRPELARAHLLYGEWLRRENRRVEARAPLGTAHDQFISIGMEAFAERARQELLATGEKVRKRAPETRDDLTEQERLIGRLACEGLSNQEIGTRLFLSARTVEWHLRKVYMKLGIHSRGELARALPSSGYQLVTD
jgi:DNA-binding CsgD family transcriptional regulator